MIKDNNIYFYEYRGIASHGLEVLNYVCVAGTPDDLGFCEIIFSADFINCFVDCFNSYDKYYLFDGTELHENELSEEQYEIRQEYESRRVDKPWWKNFEDAAYGLWEKYKPIAGSERSITIGRTVY